MTGAGLGLLLALPLLALVAAAVAISLGRPVLFRQRRAGRHGIPFTLVKFRTMRDPEPGEEGPEHDHLRINRLGRVLRSTSLDELPELWNVLIGQMSLVGPRPFPVSYTERYDEEQVRRLDVRPGLTGWAQVHGRNTVGWMERLAYDQWYVRHQSLALDLRIIAMTVAQVVRREGVDHAEGVTMHEFRGGSAPKAPAVPVVRTIVDLTAARAAAPATPVPAPGSVASVSTLTPPPPPDVQVIDLRDATADAPGPRQLPPPRPEERKSA